MHAVHIDIPAIVMPAHSWFEPSCCGGKDCVEIQVRIEPGGYRMPDGELIRYTAPVVKKSRDGQYYQCKPIADSPTRCLYVPEPST